MLCLGRPPLERELEMLETVLEQERADCAAGDVGRAAADRRAVRRLGAWITVARVLLNLDEFVTRE